MAAGARLPRARRTLRLASGRLVPLLRRWEAIPLRGGRGPAHLIRSTTACDVLILASTYGNGHIQAGRAVAEGIVRTHPELRVEMLDYFDLVHPLLNAATRFAYIQSVRRAPILWREFYVRTGQIPPDSFWQQRLYHLGIDKLRLLLDRARPAVVVATHPTPAGVMAELRADGGTGVPPVAVVITDYILHSQWVHPAADVYLAPCDEVADALRSRGIPASRIAVTGIPIRMHWAARVDRAEARRRLGIAEDQVVILFMPGAYGMMRGAVAAFRALARAPLGRQAHLVAITGYDRHLLERLVQEKMDCVHDCTVLGYVEDVPSWMAASDLVVSKAGGLTVSEAMAAGVPMVLFAPIPGQEEGNAAYLRRHGAAEVAPDPPSLAWWVQRLVVDQPERLEAMRRAARELGRPHAAEAAAHQVLSLL